MYIKINEKKYEVSTNLGTGYEIEKVTGKKIKDVIASLEDSDIKQLCELLYIGFKRHNDVTEEKFIELILNSNNLGMLGLQREAVVFLRLIISADADEKDIREELDKAMKKSMEETEEKVNDSKN